MSKRVQLSNLVEAIKTGMITVTRAESKTKISMVITDVNQIAPERFIESINLLNRTIFGDSIDFFYEFTEDDTTISRMQDKKYLYRRMLLCKMFY